MQELHPGELLPPKEDFFEKWPVDNPDETLDAVESCEVEIPTKEEMKDVRPNDHIWELRNAIANEIAPEITKNQNKWDEESVLV